AGRFGWTSNLLTPKLFLSLYKFLGWRSDFPWWVYIIGYVIYFYAQLLKYWCMWTNRWFSSTVRIQFDRDHKVVQDGPYRFIRHPGYISGILIGYGSSLILGSLWGLIPASIVLVLLVIRTSLEDKTLQKELPGYAEYTKKVKHRLLPGIW
ncbi:MAG: methyltransferase family protein, partial [Promethearchaeota archaeon]